MRVGFWAASKDGSSWYRAEQPAEALTWLGHDTWVSPRIQDMPAMLDVVVGSRVANDGPTEWWQGMAARPLAERPKLVLDLDDDYFHLDPGNRIAYDFWTQDGKQANLIRNMVAADVVTVCSEALAEAVRAACYPKHVNVEVVENGLHAAYLGLPRNYDPDEIVIGWSGSAATAPGYDMVRRAIRLALDTYPNVRHRTVGLPDGAMIQGERCETAGWLPEVERYLAAVNTFDIWLAPYPDTEFNRAKFPTKALEAGTLGIPLIASDIRPYREWAERDGNGAMLIRNEHEWTREIRLMIKFAKARREIGEAGRSRAARNILQEVSRRWEEVLTR